MLSVQRLKEFTATLRFRLVLWIVIVVFATVAIKNIAVREAEQYLLRRGYDEFLHGSLEEVQQLVTKLGAEKPDALQTALTEKVRLHESRSWFLQIYDQRGRLIFNSVNAPALRAPALSESVVGPYDLSRHRILESRVKRETGEIYYLRCGFLHMELQDDIEIINQNLLIASVSILIFAPLVGYVIAWRATRPISQIISAASHMQPSNLSERLPIRGTGDELDRLSVTINSLLDRLAAYIDEKRDFVANAAHELRSPLTAIRTVVEVSLNRGRTSEEYAATLADVLEEIMRLTGLVNRLLILAEVDAGRVARREQVTRLDKIVRESVAMFEAVAEQAGVQLAIAETTPALVPGDETYLRQIVRNLLDNAIKYNNNPGQVTLALRVEPARKQVVLSVKDTGIGIERSLLRRIFERFYRTDKSRARGQERAGSGLGLAICETLVTALEGSITVDSEVGVGSTFTIRLPLIDDPAALTQSGEKHMPLSTGS